MPGPLHGIRIVDLSIVLMGPYATQLLGDMGAEVIKIESSDGDLVRQIAPMRNAGMSAMFMSANRSKRSIILDLKTAAGKAVVHRLVESADVFVYNVRPQAMARLGLTYEMLRQINPRIIYCGVFGYGENGRYAGRPAYDDLIQGASALPSLLLAAGASEPRYVPFSIADRTTGLMAVTAILGALYHCRNTGEGQRIDMPMFETMAAFVLNDHLGGAAFRPPIGKPGYARQMAKDRKPYKTKDGYVCTMIYNDKHWQNFRDAMGAEAPFTADPRFATYGERIKHSDEVLGKIAELFLSKTTSEWISLLESIDVPVMPLHTLESLFDDPHLADVGFFGDEQHPTEGALLKMPAPGSWSKTQPASTRPAPRLGEHTEEILLEAGYTESEVADLISSGAARAPIGTR